jgi:hypothetical protein
LEAALLRGVPSGLRTKDGREIRVAGSGGILLPKDSGYVLLFDHAGHLTAMPLIQVDDLELSPSAAVPVAV